MPGYLRTHPVTTERIADAQNRAAALPYKQHPDSVEFHLVRAKLRAEAGDARDAVRSSSARVQRAALRQRSRARATAWRARCCARGARRTPTPRWRALRATGASSPMIETLAARVRQAQGDVAGAAKLLAGRARAIRHSRRAALRACWTVLQDAGRNEQAIARARRGGAQLPAAIRALYGRCRRKAYAALGKRLLQHQAQAEYYCLQGSLPAAIEQLQLARGAGDGDFYQLSVVDARLKELRAQHTAEGKR